MTCGGRERRGKGRGGEGRGGERREIGEDKGENEYGGREAGQVVQFSYIILHVTS